MSRLDTISAELLQTLKKINTSMIIYGIESFDMEIIRQMKKSSSGNYIEKCKMNLLRTIDIGITPLINIILFHPSATKASVIKTINETLFFIQRGTRVGLNILVEILKAQKLAGMFVLMISW
ncbi:MAG: hypothetical protein IPH18_12525 [Chitinophagaceae bacterium]|nr:hypothetical protein [Chitinophagaceae bacterium]